MLILGPVGVGKTFVANALGHIACHRGKTVMVGRTDRLLEHLEASRLYNSDDRELGKLVGVDLLVLDDFCVDQFDWPGSRDVYELIYDRHQRGHFEPGADRVAGAERDRSAAERGLRAGGGG